MDNINPIVISSIYGIHNRLTKLNMGGNFYSLICNSVDKYQRTLEQPDIRLESNKLIENLWKKMGFKAILYRVYLSDYA